MSAPLFMCIHIHIHMCIQMCINIIDTPFLYTYTYTQKGGISVILGGYLCYFRGVSLLLAFLRALRNKAQRDLLRPNTINTVK